MLSRLETIIASRKNAAVGSSYVASLNAKGLDTILKKIGEEATETVIAAKGGDHQQIIAETADLLFHVLVMLGYKDISLNAVLAELERREGVSGHTEKAARRD